MPSTWETIVTALDAALTAGLDATVLREAPLPERIPAAGLVILRPATAAVEPLEVLLSPLRYTFAQPAQLEVYVQAGTGRDAAFDAVKVAIGTAIAADRTLGGLCEWIEPLPPEENDEPFYGADSVKTGIVPLTITYETSNPLT